jgi:hypothetical protein
VKSFDGFPADVHFGVLPKLFFSQLLYEIDDIGELKITVHLLHNLYESKRYPRFISDRELLADKVIMRGFNGEKALRRGLEQAVRRGAIFRLSVEKEEGPVELYFINSEDDREACARTTPKRAIRRSRQEA